MARIHNRRIVSTVNRAYSSDPHERVESISGVSPDRTRWSFSQSAAIARIEAGTDAFYIQVAGQTVKLVVFAHRGEKYLQSEREKTHPGDLAQAMTGGTAAATS